MQHVFIARHLFPLWQQRRGIRKISQQNEWWVNDGWIMDKWWWSSFWISRWWQLKYFLNLSPRTLGKMNPFWRSHIFQRGWFNHQLELFSAYLFGDGHMWMEHFKRLCDGLNHESLILPPQKDLHFFRVGLQLVFSLNTWVLGFSFFCNKRQDALGFVQANTTWSSRLRPQAYSPRCRVGNPFLGIGVWRRWLMSFPPRRWDPCLTASRNMQQLPWQNGVESELDDLDGSLNVRKARFFFVKKWGILGIGRYPA